MIVIERASDRSQDSADSGLGSLTKSSDSDSFDYKLHRRKMYQHRETAGQIFPHERVNKCGKFISFNSDCVELVHDDTSGNSSTRGVMVCGAIWLCPSCRERISIERRQEVNDAVKSWQAKGGKTLMLTLTISHTLVEGCKTVLDRFTDIRGTFFDQPAVRRLMKSIGYAGRIQNLEPTYGGNGWHIHGHALLFVDQSMTDEQIAEFQQAWIDHVKRQGGEANLHGLHVFCPADGDEAAAYLTKWGEASELTGEQVKISGASRNQWQILADASQTDDEELAALSARLFREYGDAFKHERYLYWSPRLRKKIFGDDDDDIEGGEEVEPGKDARTVGYIDWLTWQYIVEVGLQLALLEASEKCSGDFGKMSEWFSDKGLRLYHRYELHLISDNLPDDYWQRSDALMGAFQKIESS